MKKKDWRTQVLGFATEHPDESMAAYARWAGIHADTLYNARRNEPEFGAELDKRRKGILGDDSEAVDFEEFIRSDDYLGLGIRGTDDGGTVLRKVFQEAKTIVEGGYSIVLLVGSLGSGKTYCASLCLVYYLYKLLLTSNPHEKLGLDPATLILFVVQNQTQKKAKSNDFKTIRSFIAGSRWFQRHAPINERNTSTIIFLNRNIEVWPAGGNPEEIIGMNLYSGLIDEANFYDRVQNSTRSIDGRDYDQARAAFESILRRQHSRFDKGLAGPIFIASSKRYKGQFSDQIFEDFRDSDALYVFDHTTWSINPERYAKSNWFKMFIGDRTRPPRLLAEDEITDASDDQYIVEVPEEFRRSFRRDPVGCLQEIAGISTEISGGFFTDMERLHGAATLKQILLTSFDATHDATLLLPEPHTFELVNPESPRHVHVDLALTTDNAALGIGHIAKYDDRGLPIIHVDAIARIRPPQVGQIDIDSFVRTVESWTKGLRIPIASFSADGYQSADALQRISRLGVKVGRLSVDQTSPNDPMAAYETLRSAINEGRFFFPADEETVEDMKLLQIDYGKSRGIGKVDHLPGKKKDTADCLAAIAFHLTHSVSVWAMVDKVEGAGYAAAIAAPKLGGQVTGIPYPSMSAMDEIRFRRGMPAR